MRPLLRNVLGWIALLAVPAGGAAVETSPPAFSAWAQNNVHPAVARIVAPGDGSISYGSGTLVWANDAQAIVVTNWHVVNEVRGPISVHFPDGFYSLGTIQNVDRDWDLALIAIRKPPVAPVALADSAPRPGDVLTIAGYGSGHYRAASGMCTQYVAPGLEFPYEMVEVAVSARQGDSGGPIFNERGELAGVLFGEGHGRTSGSYCGRVRWFLSSVAPQLPEQPARSEVAQTIAATPLVPVTAGPVVVGVEAARVAGPAAPSAGANSFAAATATDGAWQTPSGPADPSPPLVSTNAGPIGERHVQQIGWHDIAGETFGEQTKTVLAAIGVLAIVLHALRWLGREPAAA